MNGEDGKLRVSGDVDGVIDSNGEVDIVADVEAEAKAEPELDETVVIEPDEYSDNVGDLSVEINVDELVAKIEEDDPEHADQKRVVKRRLDELSDEIGDNLEGTYNFNLDEDI